MSWRLRKRNQDQVKMKRLYYSFKWNLSLFYVLLTFVLRHATIRFSSILNWISSHQLSCSKFWIKWMGNKSSSSLFHCLKAALNSVYQVFLLLKLACTCRFLRQIHRAELWPLNVFYIRNFLYHLQPNQQWQCMSNYLNTFGNLIHVYDIIKS